MGGIIAIDRPVAGEGRKERTPFQKLLEAHRIFDAKSTATEHSEINVLVISRYVALQHVDKTNLERIVVPVLA